MSVPIPPDDTAARKAMMFQGSESSEYYPGVDQWEHPKKGLPPGKMLVQFDYRNAEDIKSGQEPISVFFTDADTLMKFLTDKDHVQARGLAEALQVGPYRPDPETPHLYSQNVALYQLQRELKAEQVQVSQPAEFGEGHTRNNLHWGEGVAKQYFIAIPRDQFLGGDNPLLKLSGVMPCIDREHRLDWMKQAEQQKQPDQGVKDAVAKVFESRVEQLLKGTPEQQERGREIVELVTVRHSFDKPVIDHPGLTKLPSPHPSPAPKPHRRGPRF